EIRKAQSSSEHDKGENNDECSAFRCAIMRMKELFHGVKTFMGLGLPGDINVTFVQPRTKITGRDKLAFRLSTACRRPTGRLKRLRSEVIIGQTERDKKSVRTIGYRKSPGAVSS